jgi:uncharacterized surface protein with fasciclin (FAS1) repeats
LNSFKLKVTPAGDATMTLVEATNFAFSSVFGVIGLTGPAEKLSLDAAFSTFLSAQQFFDAQKDNQALTFKLLSSALTAANLGDVLSGAGTLTMFAPEDSAFAKVDAKQLRDLLADPEAIGKVLKFHIISEPLVFDDVLTLAVSTGTKKTLLGTDLSFEYKGKQLTLGGTAASLYAWNIHTSNAVVFPIDAVLMPVTS